MFAPKTYKSKTSPQEALVFGLKFSFNCVWFNRFTPLCTLRKYRAWGDYFCQRNAMGFCALFVWFSKCKNEQYCVNVRALRSAVMMSRHSECILWLLTHNRNKSLSFVLFNCFVVAHSLKYLILIGQSDIYV